VVFELIGALVTLVLLCAAVLLLRTLHSARITEIPKLDTVSACYGPMQRLLDPAEFRRPSSVPRWPLHRQRLLENGRLNGDTFPDNFLCQANIYRDYLHVCRPILSRLRRAGSTASTASVMIATT
jgi:hypothetical protein